MSNRILVASSAEARESIFRFRYEVYIEELNKMHIAADHSNKMMCDEADDISTLYYAVDETGLMATVRVQHGAYGAFQQKEKAFYNINAFEKCIASKQIGITDRLMVKKEYRRSFLTHEIMLATYLDAVKQDMKACFISCEEKLLPMYFRYGFRMYDEPASIDSGDKRYKLIIIVHDRQHLEKMRSPFFQHLPASLDDKGFCAALIREKTAFILTDSLVIQQPLPTIEKDEIPELTNRA
jgi:predicted GNAT family N-acyltransferase